MFNLKIVQDLTSQPPDGGGATIVEYTTYDDLPTDVNTLVAPADATVGLVTTTAAAGYYTYVATLGGFTFDMWIRSEYVQQGIAYVEDASGNPARLSATIGGDDKAALVARGWVAGVIFDATVNDVGGEIQFLGSGTMFARAQMTFTPVALADGMYLMIIEADCVNGTAGNGRASGVKVNFGTGSLTHVWMSWHIGGLENRIAFIDGTGSGNIGAGQITAASYDRVFGVIEGNNSAKESAHRLTQANVGEEAVGMATLDSGGTPDGGPNRGFIIYCHQSTGSSPSIDTRYREAHLIKVG